MIEIKNFRIYGTGQAMRGMRLPMKSQENSDTDASAMTLEEIGYDDWVLLNRLTHAKENATAHRKILRQIPVTFFLKAPNRFWKEFDTYKIGVTSNSESTMHTLVRDGVTKEDFCDLTDIDIKDLLYKLNAAIGVYKLEVEKKDKNKIDKAFNRLTSLLPQGFLSTRFISCNLEVLLTIFNQRQNHKLTDWKDFCSYLYNEVPRFRDLTNTTNYK